LNRIFLSLLQKDALIYSDHAASVTDGHEYGAMVGRQRQHMTGDSVRCHFATTNGVGATPAGDLQPESGWNEID